MKLLPDCSGILCFCFTGLHKVKNRDVSAILKEIECDVILEINSIKCGCVLSILGSLFEKHIQKDHIQDNK